MTPLLFAVLDLSDSAIITVVCMAFAAGVYFGGFLAARQRLDLRRVERKLDALLKHHGVELPSR